MTEQEDKEADKVMVGKKIAHYQESYSAWHAHRLESDKQILTISVLAIGFLIAEFGNPSTVISFILWFIAGSAFLFTILLILSLLRESANHLSEMLQDDDTDKESIIEPKVVLLSKRMRRCFFIAVLFSAFLAVYESGAIKINLPWY